MKPKANRTGKPSLDQCQTPAYAIRPLLPYLRKEWLVWEPACGKGYMMGALYEAGLHVIGSDILGGHDFFYWQPDVYDCIVTNPPYSIKPKWLGRCYDLGKPFALLMPVEFIGTKGAQTLFRQHGIEVIWLSERINFEMPEKGFDTQFRKPG